MPVRLRELDETQLREMSEQLGVDLSKLIRLTVKAGLPQVRRQFGLTAHTPAAT